MKRSTSIILILLIFAISIILVIAIFSYYDFVDRKNHYDINSTITIAAWNMQVFGVTKASDSYLMNEYGNVLKNFDIIFVEEIRDKSSSSFWQLCSMFPEYSCAISSRSGRSVSKEQYGVIYRKTIALVDIKDFNPDPLDRFERPPLRADFTVGNYSFAVYDIHTKPNESDVEIRNLESLVDSQGILGNVILLGDMNADCGYYDRAISNDFSSWHWVIADGEDTTTGQSVCAYDRIIMNSNSYNELADYGIYKNGVGASMSDHYPVWVRIRLSDAGTSSSVQDYLQNIST